MSKIQFLITYTHLFPDIVLGPEYGTTADSWKSVCTEADCLADLHTTIKDKLIGTVYTDVKLWQKEKYKKPIVGPSKETKELDEGFKKVPIRNGARKRVIQGEWSFWGIVSLRRGVVLGIVA